MIEEFKKCTKCKKSKVLSCFLEEKRTKIGLQSRCRDCTNKQGREYWHKNRTELVKRKRLYRLKNKDRLNRNTRKRYWDNVIENRKKKCAYQKTYYKKNKEKLKERSRVYAKNNREKISIREREWAIKNIQKYKEKNRRSNLRRKELIKTNPRVRISSRVSNLIRLRLKSRLGGKNKKHKSEYLPYTINELMSHLERKFTEGMSWNNYGKWHIDHIIPDSSFNYSSVDDVEFKKCWALENLQPLWAIDNQRKSNRI